MKNYIFVDSPFEIVSKKEEFYKDFYTAESLAPIQRINICDFEDMSGFSYGVEYVAHNSGHFFRNRENPTSMMFANEDWTEVSVCRGVNGEYSNELVVTAVYSRLCSLNTALIHASYVDYNGNGIVFTGPSGIGKTTQAELWSKYRNATIVNGDKVFVRLVGDKFYAYGSPWKGSSSYSVNHKSELKGIVVLLQSENNRIRKLNDIEATQFFLPHVFMPRWSEKCMHELFLTLNILLEKIPVWLLECNLEEEAINITEKAIFNK
ncbi:MAG: hypothetical protein J6B37_08080 [Clostridia bacterium]|nr:hypothetical protein [Clostridia bacterium]